MKFGLPVLAILSALLFSGCDRKPTPDLPQQAISPTEAAKIPVEIINESEDSVGSRLVFRLKDKLKESNTFRLTTTREKRFQLHISTMDYDRDSPGNSTIYSVVWTFGATKESPLPTYLTSTVGYCGSTRVDEIIETILAQTEKLNDDIRKGIEAHVTPK